MTATLLLRRLHYLRPSLLLTHLSTSHSRLLSATTAQAPNTNFGVDYLIQSWGLSSDEAIRVSNKVQHLKSLDKPDAVLRFLRQAGVSESDIRTAVSREPRLLRCNVENTMRPNVAKLQEIGLSMEEISGMISRSPALFLFDIVPKVEFFMRALGSVENVSLVLIKQATLLHNSLEKVLMPNFSFLQEECSLSVRHILWLIKVSRLMKRSPEVLKMKAKRAEEFGVARASPKFIRALTVVGSLNQSTIDAKILCLKSCGFSQEEVNTLIRNDPCVLMKSEEMIGRRARFLIKEAGCDNLHIVRNPPLLMYSLEKRIIPRIVVRNLLKLNGVALANQKIASFMQLNEKQFVDKFVLPYEHAIPGLHRGYADARGAKIGAIEQPMSSPS